ncbi:MAG: hypothetical protein UV74_C0013G0188 [Candidatus Woesebacteria bacterium GW2011_GWB1_43_14]|uniref:Uncharacterized protein n=1 Tax=Candidatus Woesebacteria bacterium GW2011_GWB1_43_14 TaxID=1618578 RepID=A0A0G1FPW1_9BACT|nr:MAG: hypothetical protein UV74_C0013G0188 [Candidatus Woesebacteria bacterium GW2011_GWB1_43_14]
MKTKIKVIRGFSGNPEKSRFGVPSKGGFRVQKEAAKEQVMGSGPQAAPRTQHKG